MGSSGLTGVEFTRVGREAVEGTVICSDYFAGLDLPDNQRFVEDYKKRTGAEPDIMAATGYLAMRVVGQALKVAGPNASRQAVRDALAATKDFHTLFGKGIYGFSANRIGSYDLVILKVEKGRLVAAE
jgi:branched-chain amino acid transport system substrate-binding protein